MGINYIITFMLCVANVLKKIGTLSLNGYIPFFQSLTSHIALVHVE